MEILITIGYIAVCVLMFSLAIAIHEFGHFIVALKLGLKVERFSIGFGPALWKKTWKGVEYRISAIPLGGYVSIPDVDPEGTKALEGAKGSAPKAQIPAWKELLVAVAGPAMNVVLAAILACVLALIPSARFGETTTEIGGFLSGSVAKEAGLKVGDVVTAIGGHPIATWSELMTEVQITDGASTEFTVRRPKAMEENVTLRLVPTVDAEGRLAIGASCTTNETGTLIASFWPEGSVAEKAGLQIGDRILAVNGVKVRSDFDLFHELQLAPTNAPVALLARRGEENLKVSVPLVEAKQRFGENWATGWFMQAVCATDSKVPEIVRIESAGVAEKAGLQVGDVIVSVGGKPVFSAGEAEQALAGAAGTETEVVVERAIPQAARVYEETVVTIAPKRHAESGALFIGATSVASVRQPSAMMPARNPLKQLAWDAGSIFRILKALVTPKEAKGTGKAIGGPVLIAEGIYQSVRRDFTDGLGFLRFLNTNLAVMNLLPIPVLDGGLILFALIAIIFRRRVPEKVVAALSTGFMYLLLALMAFLIYRDSVRSWKIHHIADPADRIETIAPEDVHAV